VHPSFAARVWTDGPGLTPRRGVALLGIFAMLLQVVLFAWHNHPFPYSPRGAPAALAAAGHQAPGLADDDCPICFALSHHGAAPVDFFAAPPPVQVASPSVAIAAILAPVASYLLFRSRAPPRT
jgi:hypothetical protein